MPDFFSTLIAASAVVLCAMALLALGWLLTGKVRIVRGACGMDPHKLRKKKCGTPEFHCDLCDTSKKEPKEDTKDDQ